MNVKKCNMCGKEFDFYDEQENFCFEHQIGYGSIHDGEKLSLNLCCECFDKVVDTITLRCKTSPLGEE